jgi:hypothetical protein
VTSESLTVGPNYQTPALQQRQSSAKQQPYKLSSSSSSSKASNLRPETSESTISQQSSVFKFQGLSSNQTSSKPNIVAPAASPSPSSALEGPTSSSTAESGPNNVISFWLQQKEAPPQPSHTTASSSSSRYTPTPTSMVDGTSSTRYPSPSQMQPSHRAHAQAQRSISSSPQQEQTLPKPFSPAALARESKSAEVGLLVLIVSKLIIDYAAYRSQSLRHASAARIDHS